MADSALLHVEGLGHSFGAIKVLNNINLQVPEGALVGLIGPNGSGKTTLFNLISGYIWPRVGSVKFEGRCLAKSPVESRSRQGLVRTFQTPQVFESMTVLENVMTGCAKDHGAAVLGEMLALPSARAANRRMQEHAGDVCERFGLWDMRDKPAAGLSAGQRRILEIARAVAGKPRLLMLDEPSSGLNDAEIRNLETWINRLREEGISILLVSHDMDLMASVDTVHLLFNGDLLVSGDMAELQRDPRVRNVYLGA